MEYKSLGFEVKDLSREKRTAVIAHAAYNNIDRVNDISRKGMFNMSWQNNREDISFYINHDDTQVPGRPINFFEDDNKAYTEVYLGNHTLGNDTLIMMDEKIIKKASFGYVTIKKDYIEHNGKRVRELKEVRHIETSVLTRLQANPLAGVVSVTKGMPDWNHHVIELKEAIESMEKFCRDTKASDDTIKNILTELKTAKQILSLYDGTTQQITEPETSSDDVKEFADSLHLLTLAV